MASPQVENGYLRISTELMDAICKAKLSGSEFRVFMAIIRETYGYRRKCHVMTHTNLENRTDISRYNIPRTVKSLVKKGLIIVSKNKKVSGQLNCYEVNKDYEKWNFTGVDEVKTDHVKTDHVKTDRVVESDHLTVVESDYPIPIKRKDKRKDKRIYVDNSKNEFKAAQFLYELKLKNNPKTKKPNLQNWAKIIEKINRIDGYSWDEINFVIGWCQKDKFWFDKVLSAKKLREKFETLYLQSKKQSGVFNNREELKRQVAEIEANERRHNRLDNRSG